LGVPPGAALKDSGEKKIKTGRSQEYKIAGRLNELKWKKGGRAMGPYLSCNLTRE